MSRGVSRSRRQLPVPSPMPPDRPFAALPCSSCPELKLTVSLASNERETGPKRWPESSMPRMRTVPPWSERLRIRTKPVGGGAGREDEGEGVVVLCVRRGGERDEAGEGQCTGEDGVSAGVRCVVSGRKAGLRGRGGESWRT